MVRTYLVILICFFSLSAHSLETFLSGYYLSDEMTEKFLDFSNVKDKNDLLQVISKEYSELKIIVLDLEIENKKIEESFILWKDPSISPEDEKYYYEYTKPMIQSIGYYVSPGVELLADEERPLNGDPLMVVKKGIPLHGLFHELGHFLIDNYQRKKTGVISYQEATLDVLNGVAEEVFVDTLLLSSAKAFNFSKKDICFRHKYLTQNLQVLSYHISELNKSSEDKDVVSEIYSLYREAYRVNDQYRLECFLSSFKN